MFSGIILVILMLSVLRFNERGNRDVNDYIYLMEASNTGFVEEFEVTM